VASGAGAKSPAAATKVTAAATAASTSNSTTATKPAPPSPNAAAAPGARDLLSAIDVSRDKDRGAWKLDGGALISPVSAGALIRIPGEIPPQYDLALTVERKANQKELVVGFVRGSQQSAFLLDVDGTVSGLDLYSNDAHHGAVLTNSQPADVIVKVRKVGLQVLVDGKVIFERRSAGPFPDVSAEWKPSDAGKLFLGTQQSRYVITRLTLTPIERKP
jgi:hypothetical protein